MLPSEKGKKKEIGIKIKESAKLVQIQNIISSSDVELEKKKKERETLAKRLEIVENEETIAKMNNNIKFL